MIDGDWDTCVQMAKDQVARGRTHPRRVRRLRGPRRHRRHGRDREPLRHPVLGATGARLHRTRGDGGGPAHGSAAGRSSTPPTSRTARPRGPGWTGCSGWPKTTAPRSSAFSSTRRARPATSSGRCGSPTASTTWRPSATVWSPQDLIFDALTFPLSTGDDDLRGDAMATIEAIRRIRTELPGRPHHPRRVQRELRAQAGGASRAQQRVPARMHPGGPRLRHRARGQDPAAQPHPR